jgi:hypothetical protein
MIRHLEQTFVALEKAVRANAALWHALRELEQIVGGVFDSEEYICELALHVDSGGEVISDDAKELLSYLHRQYGVVQTFGPN